jgi:hypothetical protein
MVCITLQTPFNTRSCMFPLQSPRLLANATTVRVSSAVMMPAAKAMHQRAARLLLGRPALLQLEHVSAKDRQQLKAHSVVDKARKIYKLRMSGCNAHPFRAIPASVAGPCRQCVLALQSALMRLRRIDNLDEPSIVGMHCMQLKSRFSTGTVCTST